MASGGQRDTAVTVNGKKLPSTEVGMIAFPCLRGMVMNSYAEVWVNGQSGEDRVETNGQMDGSDCITSLANAISNHNCP